jgi:hypothetical protein
LSLTRQTVAILHKQGLGRSLQNFRVTFDFSNNQDLLPFAVAKIALLAMLVGCATPYQPMGALGGYQEEQLAPDIYRVAFFGNGYTAPQTAAEYVIHRCAELTEQKGYRYFGILERGRMAGTRSRSRGSESDWQARGS